MSAVNLLMSAIRRFSEWRRREMAYAELMALDDHSLADIGLHRSQIAALLDGGPKPASSPPPIPFPKRETLARPKEA
jgi:uncharacterized protein YjiS (DUF1127 family)